MGILKALGSNLKIVDGHENTTFLELDARAEYYSTILHVNTLLCFTAFSDMPPLYYRRQITGCRLEVTKLKTLDTDLQENLLLDSTDRDAVSDWKAPDIMCLLCKPGAFQSLTDKSVGLKSRF